MDKNTAPEKLNSTVVRAFATCRAMSGMRPASRGGSRVASGTGSGGRASAAVIRDLMRVVNELDRQVN